MLVVWLPLNGHGNNQGTIGLTPSTVGTISWTNNGKIGKTLTAGDGTQITNGINYNSNLVSELGTQFSAAVWVRPNGTHVHYNGTFVSSGDWNNKCWSFGVNQDNSQVDVFSRGYNRYITCSVPANTWTHLACVNNNGTVKLYKNGIYVGSTTVTAGLDSDASNFMVGRETYANGYFSFNGNINDLRIYSHLLSEKEIEQLSQGLVAHYPLNDKYMETTTNLITTDDCLSSTCYNGAKSTYGYGTSTDMYKTVGNFQGRHCTKLYMGTSGASARPYPYINNLFVSDGTNMPEYKTLSFDYYGTIGTYINPYKLGSGSATCNWTNNVTSTKSGQFTNSGNIPVVPNKWNHIVMTLHGTTSANAEWGYIILGDTHTSNTSNYWLFANMQLETKDHETGYAGVGGTRSETTVPDVSGYGYNGTTSGTFIISDNTSRYQCSTNFNGSTNAIQIPFNTMLGLTEAAKTDYTIAVWTYKSSIGTKSYQTILGGPSGFELEARNGGGTDPQYVAWNWGKPLATYAFNEWTHFVFVHTSSDCKIYVNGQYVSTGSSANVPIGNYFIGAWSTSSGQNYEGLMSDFRIYATALTADQVLELYQTAGSISDNGTMFAYEFIEE